MKQGTKSDVHVAVSSTIFITRDSAADVRSARGSAPAAPRAELGQTIIRLIDPPPVSPKAVHEPYLLVTRKMFLSYEAACEVYSVAGEKVTFRCSGEHTGDHDFVATVVEDEAGETLSYEDAYESYVLQRCGP
jgi:hypothetical protein